MPYNDRIAGLRWIGSRHAALLALLLLAGSIAVAVWWPGGEGAALCSTPGFLVLTGLLAAGAWRRRRALRSLRTAGPWFLHCGMTLVVAFGTYVAARSTDDEVRAIEGQAIRIPGSLLSIELHGLEPALHRGGWRKGDAAEVTVYRHATPVRRALVYANQPLTVDDRTIWLDLHGFAPTLLLSPATGRGRTPEAYCVGLETTLTPRPYYWRWFQFPGLDGNLLAFFRPSPTGPFARDPALTLVLARPGQPPVASVVRAGKPALVAGRRISLGEVRYWGGFRVRHEPGLRWLFATFWIAIGGAVLAVWKGGPAHAGG